MGTWGQSKWYGCISDAKQLRMRHSLSHTILRTFLGLKHTFIRTDPLKLIYTAILTSCITPKPWHNSYTDLEVLRQCFKTLLCHTWATVRPEHIHVFAFLHHHWNRKMDALCWPRLGFEERHHVNWFVPNWAKGSIVCITTICNTNMYVCFLFMDQDKYVNMFQNGEPVSLPLFYN